MITMLHVRHLLITELLSDFSDWILVNKTNSTISELECFLWIWCQGFFPCVIRAGKTCHWSYLRIYRKAMEVALLNTPQHSSFCLALSIESVEYWILYLMYANLKDQTEDADLSLILVEPQFLVSLYRVSSDFPRSSMGTGESYKRKSTTGVMAPLTSSLRQRTY